MMFEKFKLNGTIVIRFSEDMIDEDSGFNKSMLNEGLMFLTLNISDETMALIPRISLTEIVLNFTWNVTYFKRDLMYI